MAEGVGVLDLALADDGHRLDAAMRVHGKARLVVGRRGRLEVVEEEERVEMIQPSGPDTAAQVDPRALHDRLGHDHLGHRTNALSLIALPSSPS